MTTTGYEPTAYVRVTVKLAEGKRRTVWALEVPRPGRLRFFRVYSKDGEKRDEMIVTTPNDILAEKPARMSLKYGEMEVVG